MNFFKLNFHILAFFMLLIVSCKEKGEVAFQENEKAPIDFVNPFLGTAPLTDPSFIGYTPPENWRVWAGLTYPGSSLPNAMVQAGPMTEYGSGAGYEYEDTEILGFTHTNKGHWNLCNIPVLPLSKSAEYPYKSIFSHSSEKASPGYYEVFLQDYGIRVRISTTLRAAVHEYTFEKSDQRRILFDLGRSNNKVNNWDISRKSDNDIEGYQQMGREKVFFYARLNSGIDSITTLRIGESLGYAVAILADEPDTLITMKIGLSFVSTVNAKANLEAEVGEKTVDQIHSEARLVWNKLLNKIEVKGGTEREKELFYSSLYRSFLWPALRSDANGQFTDVNGEVRKEDFNYFTIPSLWDTYRNKLVLLALLQPEVTNDVIKSLMDIGELTGFVPTFFHGDHGASFIAGSYFRGINNFDVNKAYSLLLNNAYKESENGREGRSRIAQYIKYGYIPEPIVENPVVETVAAAGVSKTLEYAYDDYALSLLARELGDMDRFDDLSSRSKYYKNVFDKNTRFMRGRLEDGSWVTPFDPQFPYYEYMYREANAWQVSFYVPHDMPGLVELYGGKTIFEEKLDSLFTLPWNPNHIARNISSFIGQYCHGNQPDHEAPFAYYFVDKPEKSQIIIDRLLNEFYGVGEHGLALCGMDDAGEMSSWYVCAALGLYPLSPADATYLVSVPLFDQITWHLTNGNDLGIQKPNAGRTLRKISFDGRDIDDYFISHDLIMKGGTLIIETE